jgi:predicted amidophosphoribosyltransferase
MKDFFKRIFSGIKYYISVPKCTSCREPLDKSGLPLCRECHKAYVRTLDRQCSLCGKRLYLCSCAGEFLKSHGIRGHIKLFRYDNREENKAANSLIYSAKSSPRLDNIDFLAREICLAIKANLNLAEGSVITNIPRRPTAIRKYGFDHAERLARALAEKLCVEYIPLLYSKAKKQQKKLSREKRIENADFVLKSIPDLSGKTVILVDDVVTSGASMSVAADKIKTLGKRINIYAVSAALAYKDEFDCVYF